MALGKQKSVKKNRNVKFFAITALICLIAIVASVYYNWYVENRNREDRINQLSSVLPRDKTESFDDSYRFLAVNNVYNETVLDFARVYGVSPVLASHGLQAYKNIRDLDKIIESNFSEGVEPIFGDAVVNPNYES